MSLLSFRSIFAPAETLTGPVRRTLSAPAAITSEPPVTLTADVVVRLLWSSNVPTVTLVAPV
jgi:hypothetical protein